MTPPITTTSRSSIGEVESVYARSTTALADIEVEDTAVVILKFRSGALGVIEEGAYADILLVDGNPLEDIAVIGGSLEWFDAEPRGPSIETIRLIMKDGAIYKNTME